VKRARRQTLRRGNLNGRQRRRLAQRVTSVILDLPAPGQGPYPYRLHYARGHGASMRDAWRLHEAGILVGVASKHRLWGPQPAEVTLVATRAEAECLGPIMPRPWKGLPRGKAAPGR
jgi:hypothetical protein